MLQGMSTVLHLVSNFRDGKPKRGEGKKADLQNDIPVFCPALTDGSLGDMIYFHTYKTETQLSIDIVQDIRRLNDMSVKAKQAGMIILGGGVCKHQIANAMLFVSLSSFPPSWRRRR